MVLDTVLGGNLIEAVQLGVVDDEVGDSHPVGDEAKPRAVAVAGVVLDDDVRLGKSPQGLRLRRREPQYILR